jgi:hypothetical protein
MDYRASSRPYRLGLRVACTVTALIAYAIDLNRFGLRGAFRVVVNLVVNGGRLGMLIHRGS